MVSEIAWLNMTTSPDVHHYYLVLTTTETTATTTTTTTTEINNSTSTPSELIEKQLFCKWILYREISNSRIRIWDWIILIPNICFFIFLMLRFKSARAKLQSSNSPIIVTFYILIITCVVMSLLRCIVSMSVNSAYLNGETADKVFWIFVRFFLLSTEILVLVFGLFYGHLDSRTAIKKVLLITSFLALIYSICQGALEIIAPDEKYYVPQGHSSYNPDKSINLFSHGGSTFWSVTCVIFSLVYGSCFVARWIPMIRRRIPLPSRESFYVYCFTLCSLNLFQAMGALLYSNDVPNGLCMIDLTTYLYFSLFIPFVYWAFLSNFLSPSVSSVLFSYKHQMEDVFDENSPDGQQQHNDMIISDTMIPDDREGLEFSGESSILSLKSNVIQVFPELNMNSHHHNDPGTSGMSHGPLISPSSIVSTST